MLTRPEKGYPAASRHIRHKSRLWHDGARNTLSIGCASCPELGICGGLRIDAALYDCLNFCCGEPIACDRVCRRRGDYAGRVREVAGFSLHNTPRSTTLVTPKLPGVVPVLFHGNRRVEKLRYNVVALSLYRMFGRRDGAPRFSSHEAICQEYALDSATRVILTGTDRDAPLERWWGFGEARRRRVIRALHASGVVLVTTPNYSVFTDTPRWNDLHSMKRIALTHHEFLDEGLPAALHVNGRTESDFMRWTEYVAARPEVTHIAYEFTTGNRWPERREQHAKWLCELAVGAGRAVSLIVRGGTEVLPTLQRNFASVTVLNTGIFMKTMMRRRAVVRAGTCAGWEPAPTPVGASLDDLLASNLAAITGESEMSR